MRFLWSVILDGAAFASDMDNFRGYFASLSLRSLNTFTVFVCHEMCANCNLLAAKNPLICASVYG